MPIYEYVHDTQGGEGCSDPFEVRQAMAEEPLERCPNCNQPCHRIFSSFATIKSARGSLHPKNLERLGFTQYKRGEKGYDKTFGDGPSKIQRDP